MIKMATDALSLLCDVAMFIDRARSQKLEPDGEHYLFLAADRLDDAMAEITKLRRELHKTRAKHIPPEKPLDTIGAEGTE